MSQSTTLDGTRLTVFQHLLRSLQRPPAGPFTAGVGRKKGITAAAHKNLVRLHSKAKQQANFTWIEDGWAAPASTIKPPDHKSHDEVVPSQCYQLDSELFDEQSCVPIVILLATRAFLLRIIEGKFQTGSYSDVLTSDPVFPLSPRSAYARSLGTPRQTSSSPSATSPLSSQSLPQHASRSIASSPSDPTSPSLVCSLTAIEYESLHNLLREGCAANSSTTRMISAECIGILGAIACLSADAHQLSRVAQTVARWAETYSNMVGISSPF